MMEQSTNPSDPNYKAQVRAFLDGYDKAVSEDKQASHCAECNNCVSHCPQHIGIPQQMKRISKMVEDMRKVVS